MATRIASRSNAALLATETVDEPPGFNWTVTPSTPESAEISSVTLDTQCEHVIPSTR
jgi:hypothetical protein